ncbi:hypothetical protein MRB53_020838 [Persea americana]|uniref:Uncharacterized protein n=1 Tax=Persea americana TaxID=3435 RepID=A0ACC2L2Y1_PERAE|nr:hypothetical protein MRB53_020838 [Persea americana]
MDLIAAINNWMVHYNKRSANRMADLLAKVDVPFLANVSASLPPQIRKIYVAECEKSSAYTRASYHDPWRESATSMLCSTRPGNIDTGHVLKHGSCNHPPRNDVG